MQDETAAGESDQQLTTRALQMFANYIETGDPCLTANDAAVIRAANPRLVKQEKVLDSDQLQLVSRLRSLASSTDRGVSSIRPMSSAPTDGRYILLFGDSGYTTVPYRCEVCRYYPAYRPRQPWVTIDGDSFLDSGGPPVGWLPYPELQQPVGSNSNGG